MAGHNTTQNQKITSAIISALVLWLAFSGMAAAEQFYVNEGGWWREGGVVNASGTPISAAVGAAAAGDLIYVSGGMYDENVNVNKSLTLEGAGADVVTVTAADPDDHVFEVTADYVNISGLLGRGATDYNMAGVYLGNADYCNISKNNVYGNYYGIYLSSSSNNTLTNNTANLNNRDGIYLSSSSNNMLTNNTLSSNAGNGICIGSSSNNTLTNNTANSNNNHGIYIDSSSNNTLTNNTANSNNDYGVCIGSSSNNMLMNNTASNNDYGIYLYFSSNNTLTDNTASNNNYGIYLSSSSNNMLTNNSANLNNYRGICIDSSSNNTLTNNNCSNNYYGIHLDNADNNIISCNWVHHNTQYGFYLTGGRTGNNISYNNIIENGNYNTMSGGWEWQFYINQYQPVEAKHNYWGAGMNNSTIDASIYDDEEGWGEVEFYPFETEPVQCPLTPEPYVFTTTDAVIALQIASGSRPPDLHYDASGDGSVTSLDALMILQAAAGGIETVSPNY